MTALGDYLAAHPLPGRRQEGWRWSDLSAAPALSLEAANDARPDPGPLWVDVPGPRLLFVDGRYDAAASDPGPLTVAPAPARPGLPLADLAADFAHGGARLTLADGGSVAGVIQIVHVATGGPAQLTHAYHLAPSAQAVVLETYAAAGRTRAWTNVAADITLRTGARLARVVRVLGPLALHTETLTASVGEAAALDQVALVACAGNARLEARVTTDGTGAFVALDGVALGRSDSVVDIVNRVEHAAPGGSSRQTWRAVADDLATVSVSGGVAVARGAQKTDAAQSIRALLLKRTATANAKPELEIFADDVKCAHGCTVGELDRQALFYLAARGVDPAAARALLTEAFALDALAGIADEAVRDALTADARAWLHGGHDA